MRWRHIWAVFSHWWVWVPSVVSILAVLYYTPKKMIDQYYWWCEVLVDNKVLVEVGKKNFIKRFDFVDHAPFKGPAVLAPLHGLFKTVDIAVPHTVSDLANVLKRRPTRILRSLVRLERRGKVVRVADGWYGKD